jgi:transcriptional regulator with XRE-family HTH domain
MPPTLGERVLLMRRRRGLTQRELAERAGINKNTISRLEQGDMKDLGGMLVAKIATALQVSTDYLLGMTEQEESHLQHAVVA